MTPTLSLSPLTQTICPTQDWAVLVRLHSPALPDEAKRPTLNLSIVIDASSSMRGVPLEQAKHAALHLIDHMAPTDRVSVVAYGSEPLVVLASSPVATLRDTAKASIMGIQDMGMTALHAGWLQGAQQLAPYTDVFDINRVVLISDGQANVGEQDPTTLVAQAQRLLEEGNISTSTYGLGYQFNEHLMTSMALGGLACYAESADSLAPYFATEFHAMAHTVGHNAKVRLSMQTQSGRVLYPTSTTLTPTAAGEFVALGSMIADSEAWTLFTLSGADLGQEDTVVCSAEAVWSEQGRTQRLTQTLTLPVGQTAGPEDDTVSERLKEAKAAQIQVKAREAVLHGDMVQASVFVQSLQQAAGNNVYVAGVASTLDTMLRNNDRAGFMKEAAYGSHTMSTRSVMAYEAKNALGANPLDRRKFRQGKI